MTVYAQIDTEQRVIQFVTLEGTPEEVGTFIEVGEAMPWSPPFAEAELRVNNGAPYWHDPRSIEQAKLSKNLQINSWRLTANQSTFTFSGKQIAVDALSRSDIDASNGIISLTGALPGGWPGAWKATDNTYVMIPDIATWTAFYAAMVTQGTTNFMYAQSLKAALLAAATVAEVDAITW